MKQLRTEYGNRASLDSIQLAALLGYTCLGARDLGFALASLVSGVLFDDFENESFTRGGFSCPADQKEAQARREQEVRSLSALDIIMLRRFQRSWTIL
jgi:hypothetical protein